MLRWLCYLLTACSCFAEPLYQFYKTADHEDLGLIWTIKEGDGGMWVGANDNLLTFDGEDWKSIDTGSAVTFRAIAVDQDQVWIGAAGALGYVTLGSDGTTEYTSILDELDEEEPAPGDVWDVIVRDDGVFFIESKRVFRWNKGSLSVFHLENARRLIPHLVDNQMILHQRTVGLVRWTGTGFETIAPDNPVIVAGVIYLGNDQGTIKGWTVHGTYFQIIDGVAEAINQLAGVEQVFYAMPFEDGFLLCTYGGVYLTDNLGRLKNETPWLKGQAITHALLDKSGRLWLATVSGVVLAAPGTNHFGEEDDIFTLIQLTPTEDGLLMCGPQGVHTYKNGVLKHSYDHPIWHIFDIGERLVTVEKESITLRDKDYHLLSKIQTRKYPMHLIQSQSAPDIYLASGDWGLILLRITADTIELIDTTSPDWTFCFEIVEQPVGIYWCGTFDRGLVRVNIRNPDQPEFQSAVIDEMEASTFGGEKPTWTKPVTFNDRLILLSDLGLFEKVPMRHKFKRVDIPGLAFGKSAFDHYFHVDDRGRGWLLAKSDRDYQLYQLILENGEYAVTSYQLPNTVSIAQARALYIDATGDKGYIAGNGLLEFDLKTLPAQIEQPVVRLVAHYAPSGQITRGKINGAFEFPTEGHLRFAFSSPAALDGSISYRSRLLPDGSWAEYSSDHSLELFGLSPGSHSVAFQAQDSDGVASLPARYDFHIRSPWYFTPTAYYAFIVFGLISGVGVWRIVRFRKQRRTAEYQQKLQHAHRIGQTSLKKIGHEAQDHLAAAEFSLSAVLREDLPIMAQKNLKTIKYTMKQLRNLFEKSNELTEVTGGKIKLNPTPFSLFQLFNGIYDTFEQRLKTKGNQLFFLLSGCELDVIQADRGKLESVINNLIANAHENLNQGKIDVEAISALSKDGQPELSITISDDGPGIPKDKSEAIFDLGYTTQLHRGGGLGLFICRQLIERMGGTIIAANRDTGGAIFTIRLYPEIPKLIGATQQPENSAK